MPTKSATDVFGDGKFRYEMLDFGRSYETKLEMNRCVDPLAPGRYRVIIWYHNWVCIAYAAHPNMIVFSSDPFELVVRHGAVGSQPADAGKRESE